MAWPYKHKPFEDSELREILESADEHGDTLDRLSVHTLAWTGLRVSEFTHLESDWMKFQRDELRVPAYRPCSCSECQRRADDLRESRNEIPPGQYDEIQAIGENGEVLNRYKKYAERAGVGRRNLDALLDDHSGAWFPKSEDGARLIPVKDQDAFQLLRDYFRLNDAIGITRQTVSNRLESLAAGERAEDQDPLTVKVHAHRFRHFYGTHLARNGFGPYEIKSVMGHSDIQTSMAYVEFSGQRIHDSFDDNWSSV